MSKSEIIAALKNPATHGDLKFREIEKEEDGKIYVNYFGHEVGGSYVYDYEVAPKYVEDLEYSCNCKVTWTKRTCGGIGRDIYHFTVDTKRIVDRNKWKPIGTLLSVVNCYIAFDYQMGWEWACLHILHKALLENSLPEEAGIKMLKDEQTGKNVIWFGENKIAYIVDCQDETWHNFHSHNTSKNRKHTHAIYDLLIDKREFLDIFNKKYQEIVNILLEKAQSKVKCTEVCILHDYTYGDYILVQYSNGNLDTIRSDWYIISNVSHIKESQKDCFIRVRLNNRVIHGEQGEILRFKKRPKLDEIVNSVFGEKYFIKSGYVYRRQTMKSIDHSVVDGRLVRQIRDDQDYEVETLICRILVDNHKPKDINKCLKSGTMVVFGR